MARRLVTADHKTGIVEPDKLEERLEALEGGGGESSQINTARGYAAGRFYMPDEPGYHAGNNYLTMTANRLYAAGRYTPRGDCTVTGWGVFISAAGAGSVIKAGLWAVQDNGMPGALVADMGQVSGESGGVEALVVANVPLAAGVTVVLGLVAQGGTPQVPAASQTENVWGVENDNVVQLSRYGYNVWTNLASDGVSGALGAWPGTYAPYNAAVQPRAGLRF